MADDTQVPHFLREQFARVNGKLDNVAASQLDIANQSIRIDRIAARLEHIERRLELVHSF